MKQDSRVCKWLNSEGLVLDFWWEWMQRMAEACHSNFLGPHQPPNFELCSCVAAILRGCTRLWCRGVTKIEGGHKNGQLGACPALPDVPGSPVSNVQMRDNGQVPGDSG